MHITLLLRVLHRGKLRGLGRLLHTVFLTQLAIVKLALKLVFGDIMRIVIFESLYIYFISRFWIILKRTFHELIFY